MTIEELYKHAKSKGIEKYEIYLQYQDGGGVYCGSAKFTEIEVDDGFKEVILS